jgi:hypothetical protein
MRGAVLPTAACRYPRRWERPAVSGPTHGTASGDVTPQHSVDPRRTAVTATCVQMVLATASLPAVEQSRLIQQSCTSPDPLGVPVTPGNCSSSAQLCRSRSCLSAQAATCSSTLGCWKCQDGCAQQHELLLDGPPRASQAPCSVGAQHQQCATLRAHIS